MVKSRGYTKYAIQEMIEPFEFEKIASECMFNIGYTKIDPRGGARDGGIDAILRDEELKRLFHYSKRNDWEKKIIKDVEEDIKNGVSRDFKITFCTTEKVKGRKKDTVPEKILKDFGYESEIFDIEKFVLWLDNTSWGQDIKNRYGISLDQVNSSLTREILLKIEFCCHSFKSDYVFIYPSPFQIRDGDKYIDIWDKMEKVTTYRYSLKNWEKYRKLFDTTLVNVVAKLRNIDSNYSVKIPDEIRATMIQVIRQLQIEINVYLSMPNLLKILPVNDENVYYNVRFREVIRQLAKLARKCKKKRALLE